MNDNIQPHPLRECALEFVRLDRNDKQVSATKRLTIEKFECNDSSQDEGRAPPAIMDPRHVTCRKLVEWLQQELEFYIDVDILIYSLPGRIHGTKLDKSSTRIIDSDISLRSAVKVLQNVEGSVLNVIFMRGKEENIADAEKIHQIVGSRKSEKLGRNRLLKRLFSRIWS